MSNGRVSDLVGHGQTPPHTRNAPACKHTEGRGLGPRKGHTYLYGYSLSAFLGAGRTWYDAGWYPGMIGGLVGQACTTHVESMYHIYIYIYIYIYWWINKPKQWEKLPNEWRPQQYIYVVCKACTMNDAGCGVKAF